jgi:hypothetical protein
MLTMECRGGGEGAGRGGVEDLGPGILETTGGLLGGLIGLGGLCGVTVTDVAAFAGGGTCRLSLSLSPVMDNLPASCGICGRNGLVGRFADIVVAITGGV